MPPQWICPPYFPLVAPAFTIRRLYPLGYFFYLVQLVLALVFYRERTAFADAALHLYEIARDGDLAIQNYRFGAAFTQAFPIAGVAAGASLTTLMLLYSSAFIMLHGLVYAVCQAVGNLRAGLVLLLTDSLFATDTFFWIQSELPQGLAMACLLFALVHEGGTPRRVLRFLCIALLAPVVAFMHPLLIFPVVFWAGYLLLRRPARGERMQLAMLIGVFLASVAVKTLYFKTAYDSGAFEGLRNFRNYFPDYFHLYANKRLLIRAGGPYLLLPLAVIAVVWWARRRRLWPLLAWIVAFVFGYGLLIHVSYPGPEIQAFYIENAYLPLATMLAVPLVYDVLGEVKTARTMRLTLTGVLIFAVVRFVAAGQSFSDRLTWMRALVAKTGSQKIIVPQNIVPTELLRFTWGTSFEAWLLSTSETGRSTSLIVAAAGDPAYGWTHHAAAFLEPWSPYAFSALPRRYFRFADTTSPYRIATTADLPLTP